jgi:peptide/nickel transport system ATP-binding protein
MGSSPLTLPPRPAGQTGQPAILSVRDLRTYFFQDEGTVKAVDGASFDVYPSRTLGIVGESGCGKSVTARSILRIVERPGRIVSGSVALRRDDGAGSEVDLTRLDATSQEMRQIRGGDIGLVFQEPMTSFSPVHTIGNQMIETIVLHQQVGKSEGRSRAIEMLRLVGVPSPSGGSTSSPSSSAGACASGR